MKSIIKTVIVLFFASLLFLAVAESENEELFLYESMAREVATSIDSFDEFAEEKDLEALKSIDGVLFYGKTLVAYPGLRTNETYDIPPGTTSIMEDAFTYMQKPYLRTLSFPSECISIPPSLFYADGLSEVVEYRVAAGNNLFTALDGFLFNNVTGTIVAYPRGREFTVLRMPDSVKSIGEGAFAYNEKIEEVILPDCLLTIGDYAFEWCVALKKITFGSELKNIGVSSFEACSELQQVTLPISLRVIAPLAFAQSAQLHTVIILDGCEVIGEGAFMGCPIKEIHLPSSISYIGNEVFGMIGENEFEWAVHFHVTKGSFAEAFVLNHLPRAEITYVNQ